MIRGDMSLVGPRPLLMEYLPRYTPEQARRHDAMPGLTGLAQVSGRNALSWHEKFALDGHYTRNVKRWRDGEMVLRWIGTALHEASGGFRAVRGFRDMKRLAAALDEHVQLATHIERKVA